MNIETEEDRITLVVALAMFTCYFEGTIDITGKNAERISNMVSQYSINTEGNIKISTNLMEKLKNANISA